MNFTPLDYGVFLGYCCIIIGIGLFVSREKKGKKKDSSDYFLASKALPWWAIGSSLIASNISAEQVVAMSGSGYVLGLGIATYEWMAAATLLIVGKYFLPIFLKKGIYTMPQFLELRFDHRVRTIMSIFWILLYIFVNLTSVLYLGAISMETIMGIPFFWAIIGLALFSALYSIYGGLKAVAWTDVVQVIFLVAGGLITTYLAVKAVGGGGFFNGLAEMVERAPEHFDMIFNKGEILVSEGGVQKDPYTDLPGVSLLIGSMWIINLSYWGCNQYITQRALAGKSLAEAQRGIVFAGYLKLFMPVIIVLPGIAAYLLLQDGVDLAMYQVDAATGQNIVLPDKSYPAVLTHFVPVGLRGLAFAALIAAIVSSLSSMINSTATIYTMDIYRNYINKNASETQLVTVGRYMAGIALVIACLVAPALSNFKQAFQFIQEFTSLVSPGIFCIFIFGMFWKKATADGAFWVAIATLPLSWMLKVTFPPEQLPFIDRTGIVFLLLSLIMIMVSVIKAPNIKLLFSREVWIMFIGIVVLLLGDVIMSLYGMTFHDPLRKANLHVILVLFLIGLMNLFRSLPKDAKAIETDTALFKTDASFNIGAVGIIILLIILYTIFW